MERMTIRNSDGSVSQPTDLVWAEALERLAAYEDTGLDPEEVVYFLGTTMSVKEAKAQYAEHKKRHDEYMAWKKAESEGRLLILPCMVGDTVFAIKDRRIYIVDVIGFRVHEWTGLYVLLLFDSRIKNGSYEFRIEEFGKTVFLTRAEAEAALSGGADG